MSWLFKQLIFLSVVQSKKDKEMNAHREKKIEELEGIVK